MRTMFYVVLAVALFAGPAVASAESVDAGRGDIPVTVPSSYTGDAEAPLIVLLHGYSFTGARQDEYLKISSLADNYGFIFVAPDGTPSSGERNPRFWNASSACCNFEGKEVDDSAYIASLIGKVKSEYRIDAKRVYLIGHSNGGFMSYRMAHDHSDTIAALVSLAGADQTEMRSAPPHPVHVLQLHGTADTVIRYGGGEIQGGAYPGAKKTVENWAMHNGCDTASSVTGALDLEGTLTGLESTVTRYTNGCKAGGSAELWTIAGGSHVPEISDHFGKLVVEWLLAHPKP